MLKANHSASRRGKSRAKAIPDPRAPEPHGSAPDAAEFSARLREHLAAELDKPCASADGGSLTNLQALAEILVQKAVKGSKDAINIVLDRMAGRTPQAASGADEQPQHIEYVFEIPRPKHHDDAQKPPESDGVPAIPPAG